MPISPTSTRKALALAVTLAAAAGCGSAKPTTTPPAGLATAASGNASTSASPAKSATSGAVTPPIAPPRRTDATMRKGLLSLADMPTGFQVEPGSESDDGVTASSPKSACAPLVKILNADRLPGATAHATAAFSAGQDGPFIDESLDSLPGSRAAAFISAYREAVQGCNEVRLRAAGVGQSVVSVRPVSFAKIGTRLFAARLTAEAGPLAGFEALSIGVQTGDVVVGMSFVSADPADAEAATEDAVDKVQAEMHTGGSGMKVSWREAGRQFGQPEQALLPRS